MSSADPDALTAHQALRRGTADAHARLDTLFGAFDLTDPDGYARFLLAHAASVRAVEAALDAAGMADLLDDWPARRRGHLIAADLSALGQDVPAAAILALDPDPAALWGAAYVVEGSRLGGALLARGVPAGLPTGYLAAPQPKGAWRKFLAALDAALYVQSMHPPAVRSALDIFALFGAGGRAALAR